MRSEEEDEDYGECPSENEEPRAVIPYVGELYQSLMDFYGDWEEEPLIWSVTRLEWFPEEEDPETGEILGEELIVNFENVVDPTDILALNFIDLDLELERFPC